MFVSITDFNIDPTDDSTYFAITPIDNMFQPEKTLRFDKNTPIEYGRWIQDRLTDWSFKYRFINIVVKSREDDDVGENGT